MEIGNRVKIVNAQLKEFNGSIGTIIDVTDGARWWVKLDSPAFFNLAGVKLPVNWHDFSTSELSLI